MKISFKKIIVPIFLFLTLFFVVAPKKSEAQVFVPVNDALANTTLNSINVYSIYTAVATGFSTANNVGAVPGIYPGANAGGVIAASPLSATYWATAASRVALGLITENIVGWINNGFSGGGPAFVTDPEEFLLKVADRTAGEFIDGSELGFLCAPFSADIKALLAYNYSVSFNVSCTLSDVINNVENFTAFTEDFSQGGWEGWFAMMQPQNNTYGSYLKAEAEMSARITTRQGTWEKKWDWGSGFLSSQDCLEPAGAPLEQCDKLGPIKTPGKTIETSLGNTLGMGLTEIGMADSVDKVLNALTNYAITQALGAAGLSGAGGGGSGGSGSIRQITTSSNIANTSLVGNTIPTTMVANSSYPAVTITFLNNGIRSWGGPNTAQGTFYLRSINPANNNIWGISRVDLDSGETIRPQQQKTFSFDIVSPSTPGVYNFEWQMFNEGGGPFGQATFVTVTVI